jgi:hypothetical protein
MARCQIHRHVGNPRHDRRIAQRRFGVTGAVALKARQNEGGVRWLTSQLGKCHGERRADKAMERSRGVLRESVRVERVQRLIAARESTSTPSRSNKGRSASHLRA